LLLKQVTLQDILISAILIALILFVSVLFKPKNKLPHTVYYNNFVLFKILTAILFVLIHSYYYKGGDTFLYFSGASFFYDQFINNPITYFKLLFSAQDEIANVAYTNTLAYALTSSKDVFLLSKIVSIFNIFCFNSYLATSILYTLITAIGVWKLYTTLCKVYPGLYKIFALGILFYPSLGIWGSGILKDPLTFAAVGIIFSATYNLINRKKVLYSVLGILLSTSICFALKPYILYTFIPIMLLWVQGSVVGNSKSQVTKYLLTIILLPILIGGGYLFLQQISAGAGKYSLENIQSVAEGFQSWHTYLAETRDQSGYTLGEVEFTASGILSKSPQAFFVAYFRPFIFSDVRNVATLFEAIQTFILLLLSIYVFIKVGLLKSLKLIISNPDVRAFMLFAVIFGVTVGLTSYNFGALSRYKIPGVPFYVASISIIYYLGYLKPKGIMK
jgi:hypothetical protein